MERNFVVKNWYDVIQCPECAGLAEVVYKSEEGDYVLFCECGWSNKDDLGIIDEYWLTENLPQTTGSNILRPGEEFGAEVV